MYTCIHTYILTFYTWTIHISLYNIDVCLYTYAYIHFIHAKVCMHMYLQIYTQVHKIFGSGLHCTHPRSKDKNTPIHGRQRQQCTESALLVVLCLHTQMHDDTNVHAHVHIRAHTETRACIHACTHTCTCVHAHAHISALLLLYTHTHTHTHTHTLRTQHSQFESQIQYSDMS